MNLVEMIEGQLKGETLDKLCAVTGESEPKVRSAVGAAVPSLLAGLSSLASSGKVGQLTSALTNVTSESHGNPSEVLAAQPGQVLEKGSSLLSSLLGGNTVGGIVNALSQYTGIGGDGVKKLLSYVTPLALATIGGEYFKGKTPAPQNLTNMFAEQKDNIAHALPAGLSLDSILGQISGTGARKAVAAAVPTRATPDVGRWLWPLILLAALAGILWYAFSRPRAVTPPPAPVVPSAMPAASELGSNLTGVVKNVTTSLSGITDEATAETALPQLQELNTKLAGIKSTWSTLPESAKSSISSIAGTSLGTLKDQAGKVLAIPGVSEKIKPTVDAILSNLSALSG